VTSSATTTDSFTQGFFCTTDDVGGDIPGELHDLGDDGIVSTCQTESADPVPDNMSFVDVYVTGTVLPVTGETLPENLNPDGPFTNYTGPLTVTITAFHPDDMNTDNNSFMWTQQRRTLSDYTEDELAAFANAPDVFPAPDPDVVAPTVPPQGLPATGGTPGAPTNPDLSVLPETGSTTSNAALLALLMLAAGAGCLALARRRTT
jgi:LPXTG-motif cell wall-anchored protein